MASRGREVADAYIQVHGDLSKFRRDLEKAGSAAARDAGKDAGDEYGQAFADAMEKRGQRDFKRRWDGMMDAFHTDSQFDWDKVIGPMDSNNLDDAHMRMSEMLDDWHKKGLVADGDFAKLNERLDGAVERTKELRKEEEARAEQAERLRKAQFEAFRENKKFDRSLKGMLRNAKLKDMEDDFKGIAKAMHEVDWSEFTDGNEDLDKVRGRIYEITRAMQERGRMSRDEMKQARDSANAFISGERERRSEVLRTNAEMLKTVEMLQDAHRENEKFNASMKGMVQNRDFERMRGDIKGVTEALSSGDWSKFSGGMKDVFKDAEGLRTRLAEVTDELQRSGRASEEWSTKARDGLEEHIRSVQRLNVEQAHSAALVEHQRRETRRMSEAWADAQRENEQFNRTLRGMRRNAQSEAMERDFRNIADSLRTMDWSGVARGHDNMRSLRDRTREVAEHMRNTGRVTDEEFTQINTHLSRMTRHQRDYNVSFDESNRKVGIFSRLIGAAFGKMKTSWARMDSTVRTVLTLIMASASDIAVLGSGVSSAATSVISSVAMAAAAAVPLASAVVGIGVAAGLAVASWDTMTKKFPGIKQGLTSIGDVWQAQATRFGDYWGSALDTLLNSFASKLGQYDFGTPMGMAMQGITLEFDNLVKSDGFDALLQAMTTYLPNAVHGLGDGFANLLTGLTSLLAGAAPVASALGADFRSWGAGVEKALEAARKSGELNKVFTVARESLLAVLDLTGSVGSALGTLFLAAAPMGNVMLKDLAGLVDKWNEWMQSTKGQNTLKQWFEDGKTIMYSMKPVITGLAEALDILVTPEAIKNFGSLMKNVGDILPLLGKMLKVVSDLQILNILTEAIKVVGKAIEPLLGPLGELTKSIGSTLVEAVRKLSPAFEAIGAILKPFIEGVKQLWDNIQPKLVPAFDAIAKAIKPIGEVLGPVVKWLMDGLVPVLSWLIGGIIDTVVGLFHGLGEVFEGIKMIFEGNWGEGIKKIFLGLVEAVWNFVQLFAVGKLVGIIAKGLKALGPVFGKLLDIVKAPFNKVIDWIKGVGKFLWDGLVKGLKAGWNAVTKWFSDTITGVINFVKGLFGIHSPSTVFAEIGDFLMQGLKQGLELAFGLVKTAIQTIVDGIVGIIKTVFEGAGTILKTIFDGWVSIVKTAWEGIKGAFEWYIGIVKSVVETVFGGLKTFFTDTWNGISSFVKGVWENISKKAKEIFDGIGKFLEEKLGWIGKLFNTDWTKIWDLTKKVWGQIFDKIKGVVDDIVENVKNFLSNIGTKIKEGWDRLVGDTKDKWGRIFAAVRTAWDNMWAKVKEFVGSIGTKVRDGFEAVRKTISDKFNAAVDFVKGIPGRIATAVGKVGDLWQKFREWIGKVKTAVSDKFGEVITWVKGVPGKIISALGDMWTKMTTAGKDIIRGLLSGLGSMGYDIWKAAWDIGNSVLDTLKSIFRINSPSKATREMGYSLGEGLIDGQDKMVRPVANAAAKMADATLAAFDGDQFSAAGRDAASSLAEGLSSGRALVNGALDGLSGVSVGANVSSLGGFSAGWTSDRPEAGKQVIIQPGAVQVSTAATNPDLAGASMLDSLVKFSML